MSKAFKNIILLLIAVMFQISATGIYLTIHYCNSENITALFLYAPLKEDPCEHHKNSYISENSCDTGMNTCDDNHRDHFPSPEMPPCCSDTVFHISVEDDFVRAEGPETQVINFVLYDVYRFDLAETTGNLRNIPRPGITKPPGKLYGKQLAFANRQLLL